MDLIFGLHIVPGIFDGVPQILKEEGGKIQLQPFMQTIHNALLIRINVVRGSRHLTMVDSSQSDLQPNSQILVKFFVL